MILTDGNCRGSNSQCSSAVYHVGSSNATSSIPFGTAGFNLKINTMESASLNSMDAKATISQSIFNYAGANSNASVFSKPQNLSLSFNNLSISTYESLQESLKNIQQSGSLINALNRHILGNDLETFNKDSNACLNISMSLLLLQPQNTSSTTKCTKAANNTNTTLFLEGVYDESYLFRIVDSTLEISGVDSNKSLSLKGVDMGVEGTRVVGSILGSGPLFCRAMKSASASYKMAASSGNSNSTAKVHNGTASDDLMGLPMACVLLNENGEVVDERYGLGALGTWRHIHGIANFIRVQVGC
jgi:hypothetical protein